MAERDNPNDPKDTPPISGSAVYGETISLKDGVPHHSNEPPALHAGELVADRYRVVRFLARGGMGEVYEVEDRELRARIALKTIRGERRDKTADALFLREIQLSRKVTHANVCRIFDVGEHMKPDGSDVLFFTMELLTGETLQKYVERVGPMELGVAEVVVRQIAAALGAAHQAGVVHRDLKSANVMLEPRGEGLRAVVTDFGLAHNALGEGGRTFSGSAGIVGTPAYMSPEQVEGSVVDARSDLYSLGIVMYEMVTGALPFEGETALSIAAKRLTSPAPSPRKRRKDLPSTWERAIAACLERDRKRRPRSARRVMELLDTQAGESLRIARLNRRIPLIRPVVAASLLLLALTAGLWLRNERNDQLPYAIMDRGLVLGRIDVDGAVNGYGVAARNALRMALLGDIPLVDSQLEVGDGDDSLRFGLPGARRHGAPLELHGRIRLEGANDAPRVELSVHVLEAATGRERFSAVERGALVDLGDVATRIAERLRSDVHVPAPTLTALSTRGQGLVDQAKHQLRRHELTAAIETAEQSVLEEPRAAEPLLVLERALTWQEMSFGVQVLASRITKLGPARDPNLAVEMQVGVLYGDRTRVIPLLQQRYASTPGLDLGLELVRALASSQRKDDAWKLMGTLDGLVKTELDRLRVRVATLELHIYSDSSKKVAAEFQQVADDATRLGQPGLALTALEYGCNVLQNDAIARAPEVCARLAKIARTQRRTDALALAEIGMGSLEGHDGTEIREQGLQRATRFAEQVGSFSVLSSAADFLGANAAARSQVDRANDMYAQAYAFAQADHDTLNMVVIRSTQAVYASDLGNLVAAARFRQQSYELSSDSADSEMMTFTRCQEVVAYLNGGDLSEAANAMRSITMPTRDQDPLTIENCRHAAIALALEQARFADVDAELAKHDADPKVTGYFWGPWIAADTRAWVAFERWNPVEMERQALRGLVAAGTAANADETTSLRLHVTLGKVARHAPDVSDDDVREVEAAVARQPLGSVQRQLVVETFALRRLRGDDRAALLRDLDAFIAPLMQTNTLRRFGLAARLERARLLFEMHDARATGQARALAEDAKALGFVRIANEAAKLQSSR